MSSVARYERMLERSVDQVQVHAVGLQ